MSCNDSVIGAFLPSLCSMLSSSAAPTTVLRLLGNMVTNDSNDGQAMQCGLVQAMLHVLQGEHADATAKCLALRILASLSSSPVFDSVFCSSGMTQVRSSLPCCMSRPSAFTLCFHQVLCEVFSIGERVSCELAARILRNMSIHSE